MDAIPETAAKDVTVKSKKPRHEGTVRDTQAMQVIVYTSDPIKLQKRMETTTETTTEATTETDAQQPIECLAVNSEQNEPIDFIDMNGDMERADKGVAIKKKRGPNAEDQGAKNLKRDLAWAHRERIKELTEAKKWRKEADK